jgi:hypothetical protein
VSWWPSSSLNGDKNGEREVGTKRAYAVWLNRKGERGERIHCGYQDHFYVLLLISTCVCMCVCVCEKAKPNPTPQTMFSRLQFGTWSGYSLSFLVSTAHLVTGKPKRNELCHQQGYKMSEISFLHHICTVLYSIHLPLSPPIHPLTSKPH